MPRYENTFVREVKEKNITKPEDILNWYRNLYHTEDNHTEHGIMAYAINDYFNDVVPRTELDTLKSLITHKEEEAYKKGYEDCASEIFAEIEENLNNLISYYKEKRKYVTEIEYSEFEQRYCDIKIRTFEERLLKIAELKKKFAESVPLPAPEEKYFSPEQVRKMTPREIHANFTAIRKSMDKW